MTFAAQGRNLGWMEQASERRRPETTLVAVRKPVAQRSSRNESALARNRTPLLALSASSNAAFACGAQPTGFQSATWDHWVSWHENSPACFANKRCGSERRPLAGQES